eukprot:gene6129-6595_t
MNELTDYCSNLQILSHTKAYIDLLGGNIHEKIRINFGGTYYDVMRERLLGDRSIGWNLLSCLFMNRWEKFLFRDKNDRIFFDYEFEWIKPLLCAIQGLPMSLAEITSKSVTEQLCSDFFINKRLVFDTSTMDDFSSSIAFPVLSSLRKEIQLVVDSYDYYGTRLCSSHYRGKTWLPWKPIPGTFTCILFQDLDGVISVAFIKTLEYSTTLLLKPLEAKEVDKYVVSADRVAHLRSGWEEGSFDIKIKIPKDELARLEIYSIQAPNNKPSVEKLSPVTTESKDSLKTVGESLFQSLVELDFMQSYIYDLWKDIIPEFPSPVSKEHSSLNQKSIQSFLSYFEKALPIITHFKETFKFLSSEERRRIDPLAYFNVEGSLFVTRKSTILELFPESQLAVRVSGRWIEQEHNIDEDGNIYYDVWSGAFKLIIQYAREKKLLGSAAKMIVKREMEGGLKELMEYLMIDASTVNIDFR